MEKELFEIKADVKALIEINRFKQHEDDKKHAVLFKYADETNRAVSAMLAVQENQGKYIKSVSEDFKDHKRNHFSWVKILAVAIGGIGGVIGIMKAFADKM